MMDVTTFQTVQSINYVNHNAIKIEMNKIIYNVVKKVLKPQSYYCIKWEIKLKVGPPQNRNRVTDGENKLMVIRW